MAERTSYPPGTFSWAELATSDADAAKSFYGDIFGWSFDDNPIGDGQVYTMATRDGGTAAALYSSSDQPPHWNCYVTVASVDESAAKAADLGANVVQEPFDVLDVGRMAIIVDPHGAGLCLWEPRASIGATIVNAPGALAWNDLLTPDPEASAEFYGGLFGWTTEEIPDAHGYRVIRNGDRSNGGMMPAPEGAPPAWVPYFGHEDVDGLTDKVAGLGGQALYGPVPVPSGRFAAFVDPQGAAFSALTGDYDD